MGALSGEQMLTLHGALVSAGLGESRLALLAGLDAMLVLGIAKAPDAAGQLLVDLHALSRRVGGGAQVSLSCPRGGW